MTRTRETYSIDDLHWDYVCIRHQSESDSGSISTDTLWVERDSVSLLIESVRPCLDDMDFASRGFDSGLDSVSVYPAGLARVPKIGLVNSRPDDAVHGGYASIIASRDVAKQIIEELGAIPVTPSRARRRWEYIPLAEESYEISEEDGLIRLRVRQIACDGRDMSGELWLERSSVSWVVETIHERLSGYRAGGRFPVAMEKIGRDDLVISMEGAGTFISVANKRLVASSHGGTCRVWMTSPRMLQLADELAALR